MSAPSSPAANVPPAEGRSLTEQLATFLSDPSSAPVPAHVIDRATYFTLDWLGSAIAGTRTLAGKAILAHAAEQAGTHSSVVGLGTRTGTQAAAFANGAVAHITETDDVHRAAVLHPGVAVIPAALATAERLGSTGLDFLTAVVFGYEVAIRVGESVGTSHYYYWHNTSTCGVFGAAAAAGWLLRLSDKQMAWALGNAGSLSAGLWEFNRDGAMAKHLHAGHAASSGVLAAELAARDFTGTRFVLEGKRGLYAATSTDAHPEKVVEGLAPGMRGYKIEECVVKPYPSCRHTHAPVDLALKIRRDEQVEAGQVKRIEIDSYGATIDLTDNPNPTHEYAAKFSVQYCVATALVRGRLTLDDFDPASIQDPEIRGLIALTEVRADPEIQSRYPGEWCCRLAITTSDGRRLAAFTTAPRGDPENPLSLEELRRKFRSMVSPTPYAADAERLIETVGALDRLPDVRQLLNTRS
ncbi:MAG TPA: MmgE/PrpD family protein [Chloroflexota bacterium]